MCSEPVSQEAWEWTLPQTDGRRGQIAAVLHVVSVFGRGCSQSLCDLPPALLTCTEAGQAKVQCAGLVLDKPRPHCQSLCLCTSTFPPHGYHCEEMERGGGALKSRQKCFQMSEVVSSSDFSQASPLCSQPRQDLRYSPHINAAAAGCRAWLLSVPITCPSDPQESSKAIRLKHPNGPQAIAPLALVPSPQPQPRPSPVLPKAAAGGTLTENLQKAGLVLHTTLGCLPSSKVMGRMLQDQPRGVPAFLLLPLLLLQCP